MKIKSSPTLRTIRMVERTLERNSKTPISVASLKKKLPKKVNHNTLVQILEYLEESRKISVSLKGIRWIHNAKGI